MASVTCWRCRRTRWCATSTYRRPEYSGRGRRPKESFLRLDRWCAALPEDAWTRIDVRDGEKGPLVIEVVKRRVQARTETGGTAPEELLFVTRERQAGRHVQA
ncbi:MAG: hypothetical protein U0790_17285 [Isosphaeraceae bacterium]